MIAQDTGSAIIGPARADLYFGAGQEAGRVSGRLRHPMHFVMLVPKGVDPSARGAKLPVPDPRPSEKIAKLFPQTAPSAEQKNAAKPPEVTATTTGRSSAQTATPSATAPSPAPAVQAAVAKPVPLPEPRPKVEAVSVKPHQRHLRRYRHRR